MSKQLKNKNNKNNQNQNSKKSLDKENNSNNNNEIKLNQDNKDKNMNNKEEPKKEEDDKKKEIKEVVINLDSNNNEEELSESIQNLLLDKDFASPVVVKKENKLTTNFHYVTFKNSYGENTCYINVILHLLYNIDELEDYLSSLYQIEESKKSDDNEESDNMKEDNNNSDIYGFLVSLGKILNQYYEIINEQFDKKKKKKEYNEPVTVINTLKMRKLLELLSENKFPLNTIADPVELLNFILDILNDYSNGDTHKSFYLELIDEYICNKKGCVQIKNKYDKDNFMYHIYIDDILNYIEKENIKLKDYKNKLFRISYNSFLSGNVKTCEKCKGEMKHNLICKNDPDYILINCVWRESNPIIDDVMTILFLMSLKDELSNLFVCENQPNKKSYYYLFGFILYSFTLSHYVICTFNCKKRVFVLFDDEIVKEYDNIYELITGFTVDVIKTNGKAFFYPVMLIYTSQFLYNYKISKINTLKDDYYQNIINQCNEAINEYQAKNEFGEVIESDNYQKLIQEQKEIEEKIKRSKTESERKKKDEKKIEKEQKKKEDEKNNESKNDEVIIIKDDEEDNKIGEDNDKKHENKKRNKSKEIIIDNEKRKDRSKSKKKEAEENNKKEVENENIINNKEIKSNNIQEMQVENKDNKNKNIIKKTKSKKNNKQDINEKIWNLQQYENKNEVPIIENKEEDKKKLNKKNTNKVKEQNDYLSQKTNNENKGEKQESKYLGKKIYNKAENNEGNNYYKGKNYGYQNNQYKKYGSYGGYRNKYKGAKNNNYY